MRHNKINAYTGLPPRKATDFKVVPAQSHGDKYVIVDGNGQIMTKILSQFQLKIATLHTINEVSSSPTGSTDDLGQALINFQYTGEGTKLLGRTAR